MLLVQNYLLTHSLADLYRDHGVKARVASGHLEKASLNYDQIEAVDSNPIVQECRGLVLRTTDGSPLSQDGIVGETVILALPFFRFFNLGQGSAADVNLECADTALFEKLDGTLTIVYFDDIQGEWHVATRAVSEADLPLNGWDMTFRGLFEKALCLTLERSSSGSVPDSLASWVARGEQTSFQWLGSVLDKGRTYMFELCTSMNQVVVQHTVDSITLIGCRETKTGKEFWPSDIAPDLGVPHVARHRIGNIAELTAFVQGRDPRAFEGIVACQEVSPGVFNRVKIKSAQYMAYSRLKDAVASPRNVMTLILGEKLDDAFVVMTDDIKATSVKMQDAMRSVLKDFRTKYDELVLRVAEEAPPMSVWGSKEHRKAFARLAGQSGIWFDPAMMCYTGKVKDVHEYIESKRGVSGVWTDGFIDSVLALCKSVK